MEWAISTTIKEQLATLQQLTDRSHQQERNRVESELAGDLKDLEQLHRDSQIYTLRHSPKIVVTTTPRFSAFRIFKTNYANCCG